MKHKKIKVTNCQNCPLVRYDGNYALCAAEKRDLELHEYHDDHPPWWCPLRNGDVAVRLDK